MQRCFKRSRQPFGYRRYNSLYIHRIKQVLEHFQLKISPVSKLVPRPLQLLMPQEQTATASATVAQPPALSASTNVTNAYFPGCFRRGRCKPYRYRWYFSLYIPIQSILATTEDISGLPAGTYTVTITNANGCTATASATVTANTSPINASTTVTDVTCNGVSNGAVNLMLPAVQLLIHSPGATALRLKISQVSLPVHSPLQLLMPQEQLPPPAQLSPSLLPSVPQQRH